MSRSLIKCVMIIIVCIYVCVRAYMRACVHACYKMLYQGCSVIIYMTGFEKTWLPHTQYQTYDFTRNGLLA